MSEGSKYDNRELVYRTIEVLKQAGYSCMEEDIFDLNKWGVGKINRNGSVDIEPYAKNGKLLISTFDSVYELRSLLKKNEINFKEHGIDLAKRLLRKRIEKDQERVSNLDTI